MDKVLDLRSQEQKQIVIEALRDEMYVRSVSGGSFFKSEGFREVLRFCAFLVASALFVLALIAASL